MTCLLVVVVEKRVDKPHLLGTLLSTRSRTKCQTLLHDAGVDAGFCEGYHKRHVHVDVNHRHGPSRCWWTK